MRRMVRTALGFAISTYVYWFALTQLIFPPFPPFFHEPPVLFLYIAVFLLTILGACVAADYNLPRLSKPAKAASTSFALVAVVVLILQFWTFQVPNLNPMVWMQWVAYHGPPIGAGVLLYFYRFSPMEFNAESPTTFQRMEGGLDTDVFVDDFRASELHSLLGLPQNVAVEISELHSRANALTTRAGRVLVVILAILVFTAFFIIFANKVAELGIVRIDPYVELIDEQASTRANLERTHQLIRNIANNLVEVRGNIESLGAALKRSPPGAGPISTVAGNFSTRIEAQRHLARLELELGRFEVAIRDLETQRESLVRREDELSVEKKSARERLLSENIGNQRGGGANSRNNPVVTDRLIATSVTRFGVLIIAIYLVQILIDLYRYNTRTAAYYRALADALLLSGMKPGSISALHKALRPDVNFGKESKSPSRELEKKISELNAYIKSFGDRSD